MTTGYTSSTAGVGSLVDALSTQLIGGPLSSSARTTIVNFVANTTNFPYSSPPTYSQMRDRVRGVVHLMVCSPDYSIQR
jgi:hypothetical protein